MSHEHDTCLGLVVRVRISLGYTTMFNYDHVCHKKLCPLFVKFLFSFSSLSMFERKLEPVWYIKHYNFEMITFYRKWDTCNRNINCRGVFVLQWENLLNLPHSMDFAVPFSLHTLLASKSFIGTFAHRNCLCFINGIATA